jgi:hypothetical protein
MRFRASSIRFAKADDGTATVEVLPWIAMIAVTIALANDAANAFQSMSYMLRSVQDANRLVSIGLMRDEQEAADHVNSLITTVFPAANATTVIDTSAGLVSTTISIPWSSLHFVGRLASVGSDDIVIRTAHALEWSMPWP